MFSLVMKLRERKWKQSVIIKDKNWDQREVEENECTQQEKRQIGPKYLLFTYENVINKKTLFYVTNIH